MERRWSLDADPVNWQVRLEEVIKWPSGNRSKAVGGENPCTQLAVYTSSSVSTRSFIMNDDLNHKISLQFTLIILKLIKHSKL
jgi:hypothetical protein